MKFVCERYPELMLRTEHGKVKFHQGQFETDDGRLIAALQRSDLKGLNDAPAITWKEPKGRNYAGMGKASLAALASSRNISYMGVNRDTLITRLQESDNDGWARREEQLQTPRTRRDDEQWLAQMGWRMPKADVNLPDPKVWPKVSIIIPVYNAPELLTRCLTTLAQTDYPAKKLAIQVVDNASHDRRTLAILAERSKVIRFDSPVGFSEAVNRGMAAWPDRDYHILYNQDIAVREPGWLKPLIRWMESRPNCAIAGPKLLYDNGTIENAGIDMGVGDGCAERGRGEREDDPRFNDYRKTATIAGACFVLRASVVERMGPFDERYLFGCEDLEYGMRVSAQLGMECWYVPDAVLTHSSHAVQKVNRSDHVRVREMHRVSSEIYEREWSRYYNHLATTRVAFILPNFHSACGGARVVAALARQLSICGVRAEVFVRQDDEDPDTDFPQFPKRPLSALTETDIVVATRFDTVREAAEVRAKRYVYFVQQIEDVMAHSCGGTKAEALASYQDKRFELVTIGPGLAERLKQMGRESTVLDVGFYREQYPFLPREPGKPFRVLMYGAGGHKGPDAKQIAAAIRSAIPGVIINTFHRYCPTPKWADEHFRPQTTSELAAIYARHEVYVYASQSDGFAMTPIEAMACGTPVVLTEFRGQEQYAKFGENCLIAPFRDAQGVAKLVHALYVNPTAWNYLHENAVKTAERYDWANVGRQYARLLLEAPV